MLKVTVSQVGGCCRPTKEPTQKRTLSGLMLMLGVHFIRAAKGCYSDKSRPATVDQSAIAVGTKLKG